MREIGSGSVDLKHMSNRAIRDGRPYHIAHAVHDRRKSVEVKLDVDYFYSGELDTRRDALREEQRERVRAVLLTERYSMKPDVIVRGLPFNKEEDSARVLTRFLAEELHLPAADAMPTAAVHRLSRPTTSSPNPPLLARFVNFQDRDKVLSAGRRLRGNSRGLAVYEHLPPPLQTARSQLVN
ncbi:hypothetical protein Bbelb_352080 [Branchiostoma belcheri]|nr:hypothetical protein Bbelb_443740 [Branchiostoma belcheri]KAI8478247.1 hypothetical protein Bbelb_440220 [Branchiostoma belcheri]KAI8486948.1 hypothetical protein Bbelb_352080 [Branchiostoma belcheri]